MNGMLVLSLRPQVFLKVKGKEEVLLAAATTTHEAPTTALTSLSCQLLLIGRDS